MKKQDQFDKNGHQVRDFEGKHLMHLEYLVLSTGQNQKISVEVFQAVEIKSPAKNTSTVIPVVVRAKF